MARLKTKDIQKMNKEDKMKKIDELKLELMKARVSAAKAGTSKIKEIKRTIAKILTLNHQEEKTSKKIENHK
jgi:large subunit ribosomal protein L29